MTSESSGRRSLTWAVTIALFAVVAVGGLAVTGVVLADSSVAVSSGDDVWQGQTMTVSADTVSGANWTLVDVTDASVDRAVRFDDSGTARIDTTTLSADREYALGPGDGTYRRVSDGTIQPDPVTADNASVGVRTQTLTVDGPETVRAGSNATLSVDSNRDSFRLALDSAALSNETLARIDGATETAEGVTVAVDGSETLTLPLDGVAPGEYAITATVPDTTARASTTLTVESWIGVETDVLAAGPAATVAGDASLAPGERVVVTFDPDGADDRSAVATVTDDGTWSASFDLDDVEPGTADLTVTAVEADATTTRTVAVEPRLAVTTTTTARGPAATIGGESMLEENATVAVTVANGSRVVATTTTTVTANRTWSGALNLTTVPLGSYTVTVNATATDASASATVTVAPRATVVSDEVSTGPATIRGTSVDDRVAVAIRDEAATVANGSTTVDPSGNWSLAMNLTTLDPGQYSLVVSSGPTERTLPLGVVWEGAEFEVDAVNRTSVGFDPVILTHGGTIELRDGERVVGTATVDPGDTNATASIGPAPTAERLVAVAVHPDGHVYRDRNGSAARTVVDLPDPLVDADRPSTLSGETVTLSASVVNATDLSLRGVPDDWEHVDRSVEPSTDANETTAADAADAATAAESTATDANATAFAWSEPTTAAVSVTYAVPDREYGAVPVEWVAHNGSHVTRSAVTVTVEAPTVTVDGDRVARGDVAEIDVDLDHTRSGWVRIDGTDLDVLVNVSDVDEDGRVSLNVNTYAVRGDAIPADRRVWADDSDRVVAVHNLTTESWNATRVEPLSGDRYYATGAPWRNGTTLNGPPTYSELRVEDRATTDLRIRSGGPAGALTSRSQVIGALKAGSLPERDLIVTGDRLVVDLSATGLVGPMALQREGSTTANVLAMLDDDAVGANLTLRAVSTNGSNATARALDADAIDAFESTGTVYLVVNSSALDLDAGQQYELAFTLNASSPLTDGAERVSDRVAVTDTPATLSTPLAAAPNQTLAGTTVVPPGETLDIELTTGAGRVALTETVTVGQNRSWSLDADVPTDAFGAATLTLTGPAGQAFDVPVVLDRPAATLSVASASRDRLAVENVSLDRGGQIVVHEGTAAGPTVGASGTLDSSATVSLSNVSADTTLVAVAHYRSADSPGPVYRTSSGAPVQESVTLRADPGDDSDGSETGGVIGGDDVDIETDTPTVAPGGGAPDAPTETATPTETPTATATPVATTTDGGAVEPSTDASGGGGLAPGAIVPAVLVVVLVVLAVALAARRSA